MVLPHRPNCRPSKQAIAQRKNDRPMENVFPLRTAPSQIMASQGDRRHHQVKTFRCLAENRISSSVAVSLLVIRRLRQHPVQLSRAVRGLLVQQAAQHFQRPDPVDQFDFHTAFVCDLQL